MAVLSGTQGVVVVRCDVRDDGSLVPKNAEGPPVLSDAVRANVVKWKFFSSNSGDTSSSVTLIYTFEIKGASRKSSPESRFIFEFPNRVYVSSEQPYVMPTGAEKR